MRSKEEFRDLVVEREHKISLNMHPQKQSEKVLENPQLEKHRGDQVEASTQVETSNRWNFRAIWAEGVHATIPLDER